MDTQKPTTKIGQSIKDTVDNAHDAVAEKLHASAADAERSRREIDGDAMTGGEKIASVASEAKNRAQAAGDHVKRELRERT